MVNNVKFEVIRSSSQSERIRNLWEDLQKDHHKITFNQMVKDMTWFERKRRLSEALKFQIDIVSLNGFDLGYCLSSLHTPEKGEIDSFFVKAEYRNQGIGEKLLKRGIAWLQSQGVNEIVVAAAGGNERVLSLYQRCGFRPQFYELRLKE